MNDPDELELRRAAAARDPATAIAAIEEIEVHLRYGIPAIKLLLWMVVALLAGILWRLW